MLNLKIPVLASGVAIVAAAVPPSVAESVPWAGITQLGVAGLSMGIVYAAMMVRDPKIAQIYADAQKAAAEATAKAIHDAALLNAEVAREVNQSNRENEQRHHELVMLAVKASKGKE